MSNDVYANGNAIACKSGDGKVMAAFPDVCLSPPSPPAGPVPIPYPNTSFSKDARQGSRSVQINGGEVMLRDQSFYATSPLGDEAATRSFGGSVVTHVITGKTFFTAWSMDVKFEDQNVDRHIDLATCNHASYPGSTPPMLNAEKLALERIGKGKCPCCGKDLHALAKSGASSPHQKWFTTDKPMHMEEWYQSRISAAIPDPARQASKLADLRTLLSDAKSRSGCTCKTKTKLLPEPPCNVFFDNPTPARNNYIKDEWNNYRPNYQRSLKIMTMPNLITKLTARLGRTPTPSEIGAENQAKRQVNHLTPKSAGGCPTGRNNLQPNRSLCSVCQSIDARFSAFQSL